MREWQRSQGPDRVPVVLTLDEPPALLHPREHRLVGLCLARPRKVAGLRAHAAVRADHHRLRQAVVAPDLEVHRVVAGRDLHRTGAERGVDACVGDHGHAALDVRDGHLSADGAAVALVVGVHGDGDVSQDRGRTHRRDGDPGLLARAAVRERVADEREGVVHVLVLYLEIGDRRLVERAPVDDAVGAVDPAALPQAHEERQHGAHVARVHREPLARVVQGGAEPAVLPHDHPARLLEPLPCPLDERLAAEVVPGQALCGELLLDDVLGGDPGVVVAGLPQRPVAAHAVPAHEHVLDRTVQRVPHVQFARHVRGRDADHEALVQARSRAGRIEPLFLPQLLPAALDAGRNVELVHLLLHRVAKCTATPPSRPAPADSPEVCAPRSPGCGAPPPAPRAPRRTPARTAEGWMSSPARGEQREDAPPPNQPVVGPAARGPHAFQGCAASDMTSNVPVPCAYSFPSASSTRPSAVATVRPRWTTEPRQRTRPVAAVSGRTKFALTSNVV